MKYDHILDPGVPTANHLLAKIGQWAKDRQQRKRRRFFAKPHKINRMLSITRCIFVSQWPIQLVYREEFEACDAITGPFPCGDQEEKVKASQTGPICINRTSSGVKAEIDGVGDPQPERKYECSSSGWMKLCRGQQWGFSPQQFSGCYLAKARLISQTLSSSWRTTWVKKSSLVVTISNRVFLQVSMMLGGTTQDHLHHTWIPWQRRGLSSTLPTPSPSVRPPERPYWQVHNDFLQNNQYLKVCTLTSLDSNVGLGQICQRACHLT